VRVWFLGKRNKEELFRLIEAEPDAKIQSDLLLTLHFFYQRYMTHLFWKTVVTEAELQSYKSELLSFAGKFIESKSPAVRSEAAYILTMQ
jgi:hypothetical protein